jgi:hypothetical protein
MRLSISIKFIYYVSIHNKYIAIIIFNNHSVTDFISSFINFAKANKIIPKNIISWFDNVGFILRYTQSKVDIYYF